MAENEIHNMKDHDLLVMVAQKLNDHCKIVEKHDKVLYNNGSGIVTQVKILWLLAGGLWTIVVVAVGKFVIGG